MMLARISPPTNMLQGGLHLKARLRLTEARAPQTIQTFGNRPFSTSARPRRISAISSPAVPINLTSGIDPSVFPNSGRNCPRPLCTFSSRSTTEIREFGIFYLSLAPCLETSQFIVLDCPAAVSRSSPVQSGCPIRPAASMSMSRAVQWFARIPGSPVMFCRLSTHERGDPGRISVLKRIKRQPLHGILTWRTRSCTGEEHLPEFEKPGRSTRRQNPHKVGRRQPRSLHRRRTWRRLRMANHRAYLPPIDG